MIRYKIDYSDNPGRRKPTFSYVADGDFVPVVSIVTPFYNEKRENFFELAASIFNQSFQYFEWIIVNDCSTDNDANTMLEEYAQKDDRIRLVQNVKNKGPGASRNIGFRVAKCDFIMTIDSDDVLEPTSLEKMLWRLFTCDESMFCGGFSVGFGAHQYYWTKGLHNFQEFLVENVMTVSVLFKKSLFEKNVFYDENIRDGLEDWHFWLRCAHAGYWGVTIPEVFYWYRRRPDQTDRWKNWQQNDIFLARLRQEFPVLWEEGGFPRLPEPVYRFGELLSTLPAPNLLKKQTPRLLLIVPWLIMGGADKFNIMAIKALKALGWEISVVTTVTTEHVWCSEFYALTSDVFILEYFLEPWDYPRFLRYLIASRDHDAVMVSNSAFACCLMPYLRHHFPNKAFVNYTHMEEEYWMNGGHPRYAILYQPFFQSLYVASEHLKDWMRSKGADVRHIETCYINVDTRIWQKDPAGRDHIRRELGVDESTPVILHAARICAQKQPDVLIKVLENLEKKGKDFLALIAGDGEDLPRIKEYAQEKCLTKVRFLGQVENERVLRLMHGADIFFLPSMMEGIALSIYEAMSMGLAVLSADVGGQ
ncbi:MAG: glycosyltransferase, partial [Oscillospiraceae bacterium]|nr:glycosyltransferase [Oscillospiraceae bacterium]